MDDSDYDISDIESSDNDFDLLASASLLLATIQSQRQPRTPSNRLYNGEDYTHNLLTCNNSVRIRNELRMKLETFNTLHDWLLENTKLRGSRYISIKEKLLIFIFISSQDISNRAAQERFNHSGQTISL